MQKSKKMLPVNTYSQMALLYETDASKIKSMAEDSGTEVRTFSFAANTDAVVPTGWEIVSVSHDAQMGITRVTARRNYDPDVSAQERADRDAASPSVATPTYPQSAGAVNPPPAPPNTSFANFSEDISKPDHPGRKIPLPDQDAQPAAVQLEVKHVSPEDAADSERSPAQDDTVVDYSDADDKDAETLPAEAKE